MPIERNEVGVNAHGGTEIMRDLLEATIAPDVLDDFQIFMSRPRELDPKKIRIFQCHDLPEDPESAKLRDHNFRNSFHELVFISDWQYQRYQLVLGVPYDDRSIVIETGIEPAPIEYLQKEGPTIRLVYSSTPQRGLDILVPVFEKLASEYDDIHLEVFSSFKLYGWDEADKQYEPLYERIRQHPKMTYHGFVPHDDLLKSLSRCHILAYPCVWLETSCRAMLESMSAGLVCVHPNFGALPETSGALNVMYPGDFSNRDRHADIFGRHLRAAIQLVRDDRHRNMTAFNKTYVDSRFNIRRISARWNVLLHELKKRFPDEESRVIPKEQYAFRT